MSVVKGHDRARPSLAETPVPDRLDEGLVTANQVLQLLSNLLAARVSPKCYGTFKRLSLLPPPVRLAVNLKALVELMATRGITRSVPYGLNDDERGALEEVDMTLALDDRRVAHAMLCICAREKLVEALWPVFRDVRAHKESLT